MCLGHLIYASDAAGGMSPRELEKIRSVAVWNNRTRLITGALFYSNGRFVQLLEGESLEVRRLFERIEQDERHTNVRVLIEEPIERRTFRDWDMALLDLSYRSHADHERLEELIRVAECGLMGERRHLEILADFCATLPIV
ncbi:MAG: BLUF domain-containing protein [Planctomycetota bacterium]